MVADYSLILPHRVIPLVGAVEDVAEEDEEVRRGRGCCGKGGGGNGEARDDEFRRERERGDKGAGTRR